MTLEDITRVHTIDKASFSLPWPEKSYHYELTQNPSSMALVAELTSQDGPPTVIGLSVVWIIVNETHIATIAIHPDYRGQGFGKRLLADTLRHSILRGANQATLEVRDGNWLAQQMYRQFGFTIVGRRYHYYKDNNEDAVLMTLHKMGPAYLAWLEKAGV
jgi:ribosomal-protein-alanine N-acetyltransferase